MRSMPKNVTQYLLVQCIFEAYKRLEHRKNVPAKNVYYDA
ncbi:hypothetical protein C3B55_00339 [Candidatus Pseudomonas adelgestsugas]|uniref:Uncharacterized protein n=1 Tax=Candidatus Pseudomonas adelgestsugas TaxID=1302376 RepID=A0ABX5R871_9PSED|nr:hypothetical protein C3B55_00339 [Candidatus Pseudomonas adelgestsugas]